MTVTRTDRIRITRLCVKLLQLQRLLTEVLTNRFAGSGCEGTLPYDRALASCFAGTPAVDGIESLPRQDRAALSMAPESVAASVRRSSRVRQRSDDHMLRRSASRISTTGRHPPTARAQLGSAQRSVRACAPLCPRREATPPAGWSRSSLLLFRCCFRFGSGQLDAPQHLSQRPQQLPDG